MARTLVLTLILLLKAFSASAQNMGDEEARRIFRQFLVSPYETALADRAIEMAKRDGNTTLARKLRFEAVDRLLKEPPCKERTEQLEKLLIEIPSRTWTLSEREILTRAEIPLPPLTEIVELGPGDTFEALRTEFERAESDDSHQRLHSVIKKMCKLNDPKASAFLLELAMGLEEGHQIAFDLLKEKRNSELEQIVTQALTEGGFKLNNKFISRSLIVMKDTRAVEPLLAHLKKLGGESGDYSPYHANLHFVADTALTLAEIGDPRALEPIQKIYRQLTSLSFPPRSSGALNVRMIQPYFMVSLGLLGDTSVREDLMKMLVSDSDWNRADLILRALARIHANSEQKFSVIEAYRHLIDRLGTGSGIGVDQIDLDRTMAEFGAEKLQHRGEREAKHVSTPQKFLRNLPEAVRKAVDPKSQSLGAGTNINPSSLDKLNREHDKAEGVKGSKEESRAKKKRKGKGK